MQLRNIILVYQKQIYTLVLRRFHFGNPIDKDLVLDLGEAIRKIRADSRGKVLVITNLGTKLPMDTGLHVKSRPTESISHVNRKWCDDFCPLFSNITGLRIPTIAAIGADAIGAGVCLVLACDMRFASNKANISLPFIKFGSIPCNRLIYSLSRLVGPSRLLELVMTGDIITAEEAYMIGLVNKVVAPESLMKGAMELARKIADMPAPCVRKLKESVYSVDTKFIDELQQGVFRQSGILKGGFETTQEKHGPIFDYMRGPMPGHLLLPELEG